jgi:hypothetical protein
MSAMPDRRLDGVIQRKQLQNTVRSEVEWYLLIILKDPAPFEF